MDNASILVLGGTGKTGRRVARVLADRGEHPVVASRSGERRFDWHDRDTWPAAVAGVQAAYVVDAQTEDAASLLKDFAAVAVHAGVRRLVLLSARAWELGDNPGSDAERAVAESGAGWTVLRPTWFTQNFAEEPFLRDAVPTGEVVLPTADGLEPFVDVRDIAEVAAAALTDARHDGGVYALSGPRLLTFGDAVRDIAEATGRTVTYTPVSGPEYVKHLIGRGFDQGSAEVVAELLGSVGRNEDAYLSTGVRDVLGREPRDFTDWAREAAASGAWPA